MTGSWSAGRAALVAGMAAAIVSGVVEYMVTGGNSTWAPLVSGVSGALIGWLVCLAVFPQTSDVVSWRTPSELVAMVSDDLTLAEAANLVRPHIGSRIEVSGRVTDVIASPDFTWFLSRYVVFVNSDDGVKTISHFGAFAGKSVLRLKKGDRVTVVGRVERVASHEIQLVRSRLKAPKERGA